MGMTTTEERERDVRRWFLQTSSLTGRLLRARSRGSRKAQGKAVVASDAPVLTADSRGTSSQQRFSPPHDQQAHGLPQDRKVR